MNKKNGGVTLEHLYDVIAIVLAVVTGMRHGIDWDHIAAIADITSTQTSKKKGILQSFLYAVGHASVVTFIALSALFVGMTLPEGLDNLMTKIVGLTLLLLGLYVFYTLYKNGDRLKVLPRWAIIYYSTMKTLDWIVSKFTGKPAKDRKLVLNYGNTSAYAIGAIHGVGVETPSQMYAFSLTLTAGMKSGVEVAAAIIIAFALGLIITNTLMGVLGAYGYGNVGKSLYKHVAILTALFSIVLGLFYVVGLELPDPVILAQNVQTTGG